MRRADAKNANRQTSRRADDTIRMARRLRALRASMLGCARCEGLVRCRSRVVPGDGDAPAMLAFVGLAPGRFGGDRTGIPFGGDRSGQLLRRMIAHRGLKSVFITNLVRCNPRDSHGRNRDPDAGEIANCRSHLAAELALVRPAVIVCLGRVAWLELTAGDVPFTPRRPAANERGGLLVYPMYHPAYVVRGAYPEKSYTRDFSRLAQLTAGSAQARHPGIRGANQSAAGRRTACASQPKSDSGMI